MIRQSRLIPALLWGLGAAAALGQTPHGGHSEDSVPGGTRANPADAASPPLADPLKQQAVTDPPPTLATPAVQFIMQASMDGLTEVQMAQLAVKQCSSPKIRRYARRVLQDHRALDAQLESLALQKGTSVPDVVDSDHAARVQKLGVLSGPAFDSAYVAQLRPAYSRALALYGAASTLTDADVSRFAAGALSMLRARDAEARALRVNSTLPAS